ncbi:hypothetical protein FRB95_003237 [Tulasnella sp. JGI-2019a]|nr:hypothetical protein FRB95_003237 [Tulasnella sp. JGI-2019a]
MGCISVIGFPGHSVGHVILSITRFSIMRIPTIPPNLLSSMEGSFPTHFRMSLGNSPILSIPSIPAIFRRPTPSVVSLTDRYLHSPTRRNLLSQRLIYAFVYPSYAVL